MIKEIGILTQANDQQQHTIDIQQELLNNQSHEIDRQQHMISNQSSDISRLVQENDKQQHDISRHDSCVSTSVAFMALMSYARFTSNTLTVSPGAIVKWDSVTLNQGEAYNSSTGEFTCVTSGLYAFDVHVQGFVGTAVCFQLQKNSVRLVGLYKDNNDSKDDASLSHVVELLQGDVVKVGASYLSGLYQESTVKNIDRVNYFSGYLIRSDDCNKP